MNAVVKRYGSHVVGVCQDRYSVAVWEHPSEHEHFFDQGWIDYLSKFIRSGDFVVDIGAHTGDTTVPLAVAAGDGGLVIAFEPNPYVFEVLLRNSTLNSGIAKIIPLPYAVAADAGFDTFLYTDDAYCNGGNVEFGVTGCCVKLSVYKVPLQSVLALAQGRRLSYLKIDVEGKELEIIQAAAVELKANRTTLQVEIFGYNSLRLKVALWRQLTDMGYTRITKFLSETLYDGPEESTETYDVVASYA